MPLLPTSLKFLVTLYGEKKIKHKLPQSKLFWGWLTGYLIMTKCKWNTLTGTSLLLHARFKIMSPLSAWAWIMLVGDVSRINHRSIVKGASLYNIMWRTRYCPVCNRVLWRFYEIHLKYIVWWKWVSTVMCIHCINQYRRIISFIYIFISSFLQWIAYDSTNTWITH